MRKNVHPFFCAALLLTTLFSILFNDLLAQHNPIRGAGNSYVNISKKAAGGVVQPGDTLEIRTNYFWGGSYNSANSGYLYSVRYYDSVPVKTSMLTGTGDSLRLITNEGLTVRKYTLAGNDDAGTFTPAPGTGKYQIRINIGTTPTKPSTLDPGNLTDLTGSFSLRVGTYKPRLFGGTLLTTAFRVVVTGSPGDTITLGIGKLIYKKTSGGFDTVINATPYKILISATNAGLCGNAIGPNLASEFKGTFDSGYVQNRASGPVYPIPYYDYKPLTRNTPTSDGSYAIVNNTSPTGSINYFARMQPNCAAPTPIPAADSCVKRMHGGFWEIMGDHTGTNNAAGNAAIAPGSKGGYMLMVNADVVTSEAYRQTVTGLCPNTFYEYSAWVRNICRRCGIDSNSIQTYKVGVYPNLTFAIDNLDIYSSGQLDTTGWVKKGFVFRTKPGQTSAVISIRNNASGGGGNDWVIDDIALGTCGPSIKLNFSPFFLGCESGSMVTLSDTVVYSYNPDFAWYKWQRSTDGGATWTDPPIPTTGAAVPTLINGYYQYVTNYPTFVAYAADSGTRYRVVVATSNANLSSSSCSFTDGNNTEIRMVDCDSLLKTTQLLLNGNIVTGNKGLLKWKINSENNIYKYEIEKSNDGSFFTKVGEHIITTPGNEKEYSFTDNEVTHSNSYYRIKSINKNGLHKYSNIIVLNNTLQFEVRSLRNPFKNEITAAIILPEDGVASIKLYDIYGHLMIKQQQSFKKGYNTARITGLDNLADNLYILKVEYGNKSYQQKMMKLSIH